MARSEIDHLVVTAASLDAGVGHVRRALGVEMQAGGEHVRMGTHNCLLRLGSKLFLEVIAANPKAPPPGRRRWFQLDEPGSVRSPRLATWVARCDDIRAVASETLGLIEPMIRGDFRWLITIPEDGRLGLDGLAPTLIQWQSGNHPADTLKDLGCSLARFEGFHPQPEKVAGALESISFDGEFPVSKGQPRLLAHIDTPGGLRRLG